MCSGPESAKRKPVIPPGFSMDSEIQKQKPCNSSILLEFSASDDLCSFKKSVEEEGSAVDEPSFWYGQIIGSKKIGFEQRTPLMIASMFGSTNVLKYLLSREGSVDVNGVCGSDKATALHCAAAGGSLASVEVVKLLLDASADVSSACACGKYPGDVISPAMKRFGGLKARTLEMLLNCKSSSEETWDLASNSSKHSVRSDSEEHSEQQEKKEYPIDLSLPDIKNGIYGTDEFRMYTFKVKPCSRAYSHDWTECPFVHPGENARRRDPRKYHYSCVPCPEFRKGTCRQGDACEYAHGVFECWLHPAQYRTRLCKDETGCTRRVCFFAHKPEELRPLYASTGSAISPRSSSSADMSSMSPLALPGSPSMMIPTSTPPMSPNSSGAVGGGLWQNQIGMMPPALQLPGSRLKSTLSARDMELDMDLIGMEAHNQQLIDEISNLSNLSNLSLQSGRTNPLATAAQAPSGGNRSLKFSRAGSVTPSNLEEIFGSLDPSSMSQLQGLSLKAAVAAAQFQSPNGVQLRQNMNQMSSGYGNLSSSPVRAASGSSLGLDPSLSAAQAVMNSRAAAFAKRSQSFCDRSSISRHSLSATTTPASAAMLSDWGSPDGKLDWGIQGEELNKLRKSASFGFRNSSVPTASPVIDEPDVSWVQSLVKDNHSGWLGSEQQQQQFHHLNTSAEMLSPWAEQVYVEQEQMVA